MTAPAPPVPSPCTNVCRIDKATGWCEGCRRTVHEITHWPLASEAEKRALLAELPRRVAKPARKWLPW
nr:DUF1289 domain-containing protein [Polymorphobacter multimanifer]